MPENSDDSKSLERTEKSIISKGSQKSNEIVKNVSKASIAVNEPKEIKEIDFFDEKLDKASKEINKLAASQEYDDEYDAEYDEEQDVEIESQQAKKMRIMVGPKMRIDETIDGMDSHQKTMFAGLLCEYIEFNIESFSKTKKAENAMLFEKPRETNVDRDLKFKLINKYNLLL